MKDTKEKNRLENDMDVIICRKCHKKIVSPELVGFTLVCPFCKVSVNGQYRQGYKGL